MAGGKDDELKKKIRELTASWIDETNHTTDDVEGQYVRFGGPTVTLDGYFTLEQLQKTVKVMEVLKEERRDGKEKRR